VPEITRSYIIFLCFW